MRVAIVNFSMDNYKDLEEAMEKLIAESHLMDYWIPQIIL